MESMVVIVVAVAGGVAVALQGQLVGDLDRRVGTLGAVFVTYGIGGLAIGAVMLLARGGGLGGLTTAPWYVFTAGILGLVIVGAIGYAVARVGLLAGLTVVIAAQLAIGAAVDHLGWLGAQTRPLDLGRMVGIILAVMGAWLVLR